MEQGPDELTGREEDRPEEIDKISGEPMNDPEKRDQAEKENGPSVADANRMGG